MATIKIRRGSGQPAIGGSGLTAYEPAWDTVNNRFFINNGSTAMWIGAAVIQDTTLSGNCTWTIPTQNSVKTYVDNQVAAGAVTSVNGATGAVTIGGGTGISILTSAAARGVTIFNAGVLSINGNTGAISNVAFTNIAQTFNALQSFSSGLSATTGIFTGILNPTAGISANGGMTLGGSLQAAAATFSGLVTANSGLVVNGGVTFNGNIYAPNLVTSVDGVTGAVDLLAGSGISITLPTGAAKGITLANTGVVGITGTANQVTVSGTSGSVTLSLPSAITTPGSLTTTTSLLVGTDATISGNLTVNGTTTTVNSTTVSIQDPLISIGGITGNAPPPVGDTKDRGIVFQWATGVTGQTGFFGFDQSTQRFTFIPSGAAISGEIVSGAAGNAELAGVFAPSGTLTLQGTSGASAVITLAGNTAGASTVITNSSFETLLTSSTGVGRLSIRSDLVDTTLKGTFVPTTLSAARSYTLPDISGQMVLADTAGATTGWLLRGQGSATQNTWINPNTSGFTAFTTTNINLVGVKDASNYGLVFALGTAGNNILYGDSTTGVMWRPSTNTLTVGAGVGFFEGIIEGGTF